MRNLHGHAGLVNRHAAEVGDTGRRVNSDWSVHVVVAAVERVREEARRSRVGVGVREGVGEAGLRTSDRVGAAVNEHLRRRDQRAVSVQVYRRHDGVSVAVNANYHVAVDRECRVRKQVRGGRGVNRGVVRARHCRNHRGGLDGRDVHVKAVSQVEQRAGVGGLGREVRSVRQVEQPVVTGRVEVREGGVDGDVQIAVKRRAALRVNLDSLVVGDMESRPESGAECMERAGSRRHILDVSACFVSDVDVRLEAVNVLGALEHVGVGVARHERVRRSRGLFRGEVVRAPGAVAVVVGRGSFAA